MKIHKTVSQNVIKANRENGSLSHGPKTLTGKSWSRRNRLKHGILARNLMFKDEDAKSLFRLFLDRLKRDQKPRDYLEVMVLEELAISLVRRARALNLEQSLYRKSSPASQIFLKAVNANSDLFGVYSSHVPTLGWECQEVTLTGKRGPADRPLSSSDREHYLTIQAKCSSPMDLAQRYQTATQKDFYRALNQLLAMRKRRKEKKSMKEEDK